MAGRCVNDHCPFNSDEANDGCLIIPEDILDNMDGECPKKIVVGADTTSIPVVELEMLRASICPEKKQDMAMLSCDVAKLLHGKIAELEADKELGERRLLNAFQLTKNGVEIGYLKFGDFKNMLDVERDCHGRIVDKARK